jgi:hypothetical protein
VELIEEIDDVLDRAEIAYDVGELSGTVFLGEEAR